MNRQEKTAEVARLQDELSRASIAILAGYRGLTVAAVTDLRRKLKEKSSRLKVVKNRLAKIAIKGTAYEVLAEKLVGPVALVTSDKDPVAPAKVLTDFAKDNDKLDLKMGVLQGSALKSKDIEALAKMPSKEELIAKLMGSMQAPMQNLVSVLSQIPRQVVNVLEAVRKQKEQNA